MQYLLMIYGDESAMAKMSPADLGPMMAAYQSYTDAMRAAGVFVAGDRLHGTNAATTVKVVDGKTQVLDGPYAETKEQLRRLLHRRRDRPGRGAELGGALPGRL